MRALFAMLWLSACAIAPAETAGWPSPEIIAMRDQFEREILAIERNYPDNAEGLRAAGLPIALRIYGANWNAVRAEAKRSLAALPELDLSAYANAAPIAPAIDASTMSEAMQFMTPAGLAMMRFWDASVVGYTVAPMTISLIRDGETAAMVGAKLALVPNRIWRGRFEGQDVLAARYMRAMVIMPYTFTPQGMIFPSFNKLRVYDLQQ
jgi:hypothetical protein